VGPSPHLTSAATLDTTPGPREHSAAPGTGSFLRATRAGGGGFPHLSPFGLHPSALRQEFDKRFGGSRRPRTRSGGLPARRPDGIASAGHKLRAAHTVVEDVFWGSTPTTVDNATFGGSRTPASTVQPIRPAHWDVTALNSRGSHQRDESLVSSRASSSGELVRSHRKTASGRASIRQSVDPNHLAPDDVTQSGTSGEHWDSPRQRRSPASKRAKPDLEDHQDGDVSGGYHFQEPRHPRKGPHLRWSCHL
jgi:hypothetical protein